MGIFNSIKKSRRASSDIDEKIEYLNKELEKNGLREGMNTSGMYFATGQEPNASHNAFKALTHDGQSLGFSGVDYNIFTEPIGGLKYSPPHPVSGERRAAQSWFGIASGFAPVGENSDREILWVFDQDLSGGFGRYFSLELTGGSNPFWGTWISTAFGTEMLVPYNSSDSPLSDNIKNSLNSLNINNFLDPNTFGPENNPIVFKNDLGDPDFLPIDVAKKFIAGALDLAIEGLDFLKDKAKDFFADFDLSKDFNKNISSWNSILGNPATDLFLDLVADALGGGAAKDTVDDYTRNYIPDLFAGKKPPGSSKDNPRDMSDLFNKKTKSKWEDIFKDYQDSGEKIPYTYQSTADADNNIGSSFGTPDESVGDGFEDNGDGTTTWHKAYDFDGFDDLAVQTGGDLMNVGTSLYGTLSGLHSVMSLKKDPKTGERGKTPTMHMAITFDNKTGKVIPNYKPGTVKESLDESVKLGHFDPEVLNVDINDIRKGIMPEFPKDPPPEMIDGYSAKSKLAPKVLKGDPFIKVTKKDLAALHILKDSEIKELLQQIDLINAYLKNNPADLFYAQQRYPKDDIRLAKLNWKMDQMMQAGKDYLDKTFPENEKLFKKIQKSIKKNIELTDPKSFKDVKIPKFEGVNLIDFKRRKEVVSRHFKKAVKIERLFSNKKRRKSLIEEREYLNNESKNNTLKEFMTTTGMYFATRENPAIPAVTAPVPDSTGVLGSGFTPPIGGNGNANDPSNYPAAYDTAWMYNSNDVDGVTNRPIVKTMDQSVIDAYNTAFPDDNRFPSGGAGIVFGDRGFGTGVGYASGGHYIGVLSPGLFGNGSTKIVPGDAPFDAPWFGMGGMYFPATIPLANVIKSMSSTYSSLGGYNPSGARPIQLWAPWSRFHDGDWEDQGTQKYISNTGNRYVIRTFYLYATANDYVKEPAVPVTTTVLYRNDLGDPSFLPIKIDLGDISDQAFQYLSDKATPIVKNYSDLKPFEQEILQRGLNFMSGDAWRRELERLQKMYPGFIPRASIPDDTLVATSDLSSALSGSSNEEDPYADARAAYFKAGGQMAWNYLSAQEKENWKNKVDSSFSSAPPDAFEPEIGTVELTPADIPAEFKTDDKDKRSAKGVTLTKWMSRTDFMKLYPDSTMSEYLAALPYGATNFMKPDPNFPNARIVDTEAYERYFMTGDTSGVSGESRHSEATPEPKQKMFGEKSYEEVMADLDKTIEKYSTMEKQAYTEMRQIALELGMDFVSLIGGLFTGGTTAAPVLGKLGMKLLKKYGKTVAGKMIRKLIKKFRNKKNSKKMDELLDDIDNADFNQEYDPRKPFEPDAGDQYPNLTRKGEQTYDTATERLLNQRQQGGSDGQLAGKFLDDLVDAAPKGDAALNNVMNKIKKSPIGYLFNSYKPDGKLLSEAAMLGHFEPEQLNVDIEQLRKGIMPEFPEEAPPELINGYSSKSRLAPKKLERSSFIKITKKDLAKNHKLKDSEIKDFMNKINAVNDFIKKHPEELVYAQTRYPKSDPRLAQLNWEMDQKLNASKQYMDKHYPENQRLFTKIQKSIKKNVELTDPKSFKGVKVPKFKGVDLTDFKRRKAVVSKHFKKAIRKNKK